MKKVLCILMLIGTTNANATEWIGMVDVSTKDRAWFFEKTTVEKKVDTKTIWIQVIENPKNKKPHESIQEISREQINCSRKTIKLLSLVTSNIDGKITSSSDEPDKETLIVPDSIGWELMKIVCAEDFPETKSPYLITIGKQNPREAALRAFDKENRER